MANKKVLTSEEIDELLNAIKIGPEKTKKPSLQERRTNERSIRIYDFMRPDVFSKSNLHEIANRFEAICRSFSAEMSLSFGASFKCRVASVDQLTFEEYSRSIPSPTLQATMNHSADNKWIFEIDPTAIVNIERVISHLDAIDFNNEVPKQEEPYKQWTSIFEKPNRFDISLFESIGDSFVKAFNNELVPIGFKESTFDNWYTNNQEVMIYQPKEMCCVVTIETRIGDDGDGFINVVLPQSIVNLYKHLLVASYEKPASVEGHIDRDLALKSEAIVEVRTKPIKTTIGEILKFKEGGTLVLKTQELDLVINGTKIGNAEADSMYDCDDERVKSVTSVKFKNRTGDWNI